MNDFMSWVLFILCIGYIVIARKLGELTKQSRQRFCKYAGEIASSLTLLAMTLSGFLLGQQKQKLQKKMQRKFFTKSAFNLTLFYAKTLKKGLLLLGNMPCSIRIKESEDRRIRILFEAL